MKNKNIGKLLYRIKNVLFILFLIGCINLVPSLYEEGIMGILLLILFIIYSLTMFIFFLKKNSNLNNNIMNNILGIILYIYVYLISIKYLDSLGIELNEMYFTINYIVLSISMIGMIFSSIVLVSEKVKK